MIMITKKTITLSWKLRANNNTQNMTSPINYAQVAGLDETFVQQNFLDIQWFGGDTNLHIQQTCHK